MGIRVHGFELIEVHGAYALLDDALWQYLEGFLTLLGHVPARRAAEETAWVLNREPHDVPVPAARLLILSGNPPPNSVNCFARCEVLEPSQEGA